MYQKSIQNFILEYSDFDTNKLRLKNIQADFDVAWAIQQIEARKKTRRQATYMGFKHEYCFPVYSIDRTMFLGTDRTI